MGRLEQLLKLRVELFGCISVLGCLGLVGACSSGEQVFTPTAKRPFKGSVSVFAPQGKTQLTLDPRTPVLRLTSQFYLHLAGSAGAKSYQLTLLLDPMNPPERFELPRDAARLQVTATEDRRDLLVTSTSGFIDVGRADAEDAGGAAIVSLAVLGGSAKLMELSLVFDGPSGPK